MTMTAVMKEEALKAELRALDLWDQLFTELQQPDQIDKDASAARFFRRVQVIVQLEGLPSLENLCRSTELGVKCLSSFVL
jgi:hypothetical protein